MIIAFVGQACLAFALLASILQAVLPDRYLSSRKLFLTLAWGQAFFVSFAFGLLVYAHATDQFVLQSVMMHSHTDKPFLYKISGVWGNHEGSMLLWVLILSYYNAALTWHLRNKDYTFHKIFPFMALISFSFLLFLVATCDPFALSNPVPLQGQDLNPLLQDFSLAIHPPCLYLGTAGFAIPFAFAALVLVQGKMPPYWADLVYPWVIFAWTFLTLGLGLGSFWAYYELGWGGWWFWDPVENAALMPWLSATALVHALRCFTLTGTLRLWTLFLCVATFALCLLGTFLVRSGLLTSVHSFAVDPERGVFLAIISGFLIVPLSGLLAWRSSSLQSVEISQPFLRSGLILIMTLFLMCGTFTIAIGTVYPLLMEAFGLRITVGEPWFRATFIPMMLPFLFLTGLGAWFSGENTLSRSSREHLFFLLLMTLIIVSGLYLTFKIAHILGLAALCAAIWIILTTLAWAIKNRCFISGMVFAHLGIGIAILGIVGSSLGEQEIIKIVKLGETIFIGPHSLTLQKVILHKSSNYQAQQASFAVDSGNAVMQPEKRFYWTQNTIHGESAILSKGLHHIYLTLGDEYEGQRWSVHAYYKPFINLLETGGIMVILGGFIAFFRRRSYCAIQKAMLPLLFLWGFTGLVSSPVLALDATEMLLDSNLEKRARSLSRQVLCPQCQGQLLDESPVKAARELRAVIRKGLTGGLTDQQILDNLVALHGKEIITCPPFSPLTLLLWLLPWVIFTGGFILVIKKILMKKF